VIILPDPIEAKDLGGNFLLERNELKDYFNFINEGNYFTIKK
jgi:hypothetical protein